MRVKLLYFAWVRERIGKSEEMLDIPPTVATIAELMSWLVARGPEYASAFERPEVIRAAIDKSHVKHATPLSGATEIAFFPPVTGG